MTTTDTALATTTARETFLELFSGEMKFRVGRSRRTVTMPTRDVFGIHDLWADDTGDAEGALNDALEAVQKALESASEPAELLTNFRDRILGLADELGQVEATSLTICARSSATFSSFTCGTSRRRNR